MESHELNFLGRNTQPHKEIRLRQSTHTHTHNVNKGNKDQQRKSATF